MAATKGRSLRVSVATSLGGSYTTVAGVKSATLNMSGQNVDVTTLTDADIVRIQAIKDKSVSIQCNMEADASGQGAIRTAYTNDSDLFVQFLWDGSVGWKFQCKVGSISPTATPTSEVSVTYELEGSGAVTAV